MLLPGIVSFCCRAAGVVCSNAIAIFVSVCMLLFFLHVAHRTLRTRVP